MQVIMVKDGDYVAIFHSIHKVMKAEQVLKLAGVDFLLIPAPREVASDCGLAIRFEEAARERIAAVLGSESLLPAECYRRQGGSYCIVDWPGKD